MTSGTNNQKQTRPGRCETHGLVEGTRKMPRLSFPFIITGVLRLAAMTRPFRCPRCGASTTKAQHHQGVADTGTGTASSDAPTDQLPRLSGRGFAADGRLELR